MKRWGWTPGRSQGIWKFGSLWLKEAAVAAPWLTVGLLLLMLHMIGGTMTSAEGVLVDLPKSGAYDGEATRLVALVMPVSNGDETYVFFDDARYSLDSDISLAAFGDHLKERASKTEIKALLVLMDKTVACGQFAKLATVARECGLERVLFATKHETEDVE